jgi:hypothetical protein
MLQALVKIAALPRLILALSLLLLCSCKQDAIFFHVSLEVEPKDPRIQGSPSKVVKFGTDLYVANGRLYKYTEGGTSLPSPPRGTWVSVGQPPGGAKRIAATSSFLYARTGNDIPGSFKLYRSADGDDWPTTVPAGTTDGGYIDFSSTGYAPQTIFSANNNVLFIGARKNPEDYALFYLDDSALIKLVKLETFTGEDAPGGTLQGVLYAGTSYYLATFTRGIFQWTGSLPSSDNSTLNDTTNLITDSNTGEKEFWSLIEAKGKYFAVGSGIWDLMASFASDPLVHGSFKGSVCYPDPVSPTLLLLGTHSDGYLEVDINSSGDLSNLRGPRFSIPNGSSGEYDSMLADEAVNHLYVLNEISENTDPVIFASTYREGLWSYRNGEWNYED